MIYTTISLITSVLTLPKPKS